MDQQDSSQAERVRPVVRSRWSWNVGSIAGVPVRIHITLLLLLVWIALAYSLRGVGPSATLAGVALVASVFVIVLLHELTHALMARRFGVRTRDILLLPIGGIASLERIPERPSQELAISLIGPMFNLALAALIWGGLALGGGDVDLGLGAPMSLGATIAVQLFWINVVLGAFNLLPAFPLDGGRVFRALLSMWVRRETATRVAAGMGKALALALGIFGLFFNPWLVLIAVVIWLGARQEVELMQLRMAIAGVPARAAMLGRIEVVDADESLGTAARIAVNSGSNAIPIVDHGQTVGVLTHGDIAIGLDAAGPDAVVAVAPHHEAVAVAPEEPLDRVLDRLQSDPNAIAVVVERGEPIGVVTPEQLASYVAFRASRRPELSSSV
jgi:Zn-dependent protease/predicted transcriptional regulator